MTSPASRRWFMYLLMGTGAALRVGSWAWPLSLRMDEASLAINVMDRGVGGLLGPLAHQQAAPWGFLAAVDGLASIFGPTEHVLRLLPLIAGIAGLVLFGWFLWVRFGANVTTIAAFALLATLPAMIWRSADFKPYTVDVALACALLLLVHRRGFHGATTAVGALCPWFSFPSVFVLAGLGGTGILKGNLRAARAGLIWLASFGLYWIVGLGQAAERNYLTEYWSDAFMPLSADLPNWIWESSTAFFTDPFWVVWPPLAILLAGLGGWKLYESDREFLGWTAATVGATLVASVFAKYPFSDRLVLFLAPMAAVFVGAGIEKLWSAPNPFRWSAVAAAIGLFLTPIASLNYLIDPPTRDYRAVVATLKQEVASPIYVHDFTAEGFRYYARRLDLEQSWTIASVDSLPEIREESAWIVEGADWSTQTQEQRNKFESWVNGHSICATLRLEGVTAYKLCDEERS